MASLSWGCLSDDHLSASVDERELTGLEAYWRLRDECAPRDPRSSGGQLAGRIIGDYLRARGLLPGFKSNRRAAERLERAHPGLLPIIVDGIPLAKLIENAGECYALSVSIASASGDRRRARRHQPLRNGLLRTFSTRPIRRHDRGPRAQGPRRRNARSQRAQARSPGSQEPSPSPSRVVASRKGAA
jgi:hypothetical protein